MSDTTSETDQAPVLGTINAAEADESLNAAPKRLPDPPADPGLSLPRGAWLRLVVSGGFRFSTREITVFNDGRLTYRKEATPMNGKIVLARQLTDEQLNPFRELVEKTDLATLSEHDPGRLGGDRVVYECLVRQQRKRYTIEAFQGNIPEAFAEIIRALGPLVEVIADETQV